MAISNIGGSGSSAGGSDEGATPLLSFYAASNTKKSFATTANQSYPVKLIGVPGSTVTLMSGNVASGQYLNSTSFSIASGGTGEVTGVFTPATSGDTLIVLTSAPVTVVLRQWTAGTAVTFVTPTNPSNANLSDSNIANNPTLRWMVSGNGGFIAGNTYGNTFYSKDGVTGWTSVYNNASSSYPVQMVTYGNGFFVSAHSYGSNGQMAFSGDGYTWTTYSASTSGYWVSMIYNTALSMWIGVTNSGYVYTNASASPASTWTNRTAVSGSQGGIAVNGSTTVALFNASIYYSTNGTTWTASTISSLGGATMLSVVYVASLGLFVAVGSAGTVGTSPDGITWTKRTTPSSTPTFYSVTYHAATSQIIAVGSDSTTLYSTDGINWTAGTYQAAGTPSAIASNGTVIMAVGSNDHTVLSGGPNMGSLAHTQTSSVAANSTRVVIGGAAGAIATSDDYGLTWTNRTSNLGSTVVSAIGWNGSLFVAIGSNGAISTSPDGATWTLRSAAGAVLSNVTSVAYGNGVWVAIYGSSTSYATSPDGFTWTQRTTLPTTLAYNVVFGNGYFVIAGNNSAWRSADGVTWTLITGSGYFSYVGNSYPAAVFFGNGNHYIQALTTSNPLMYVLNATALTSGASPATQTGQWPYNYNTTTPYYQGGYAANSYVYTYGNLYGSYFFRYQTGIAQIGNYLIVTGYSPNTGNPGQVFRTNAATIL